MAKKKKTKRSRKKAAKTSSFIKGIKNIFIAVFIVLLCLIGSLFVYDYFHPLQTNSAAVKSQTENKKEIKSPQTEKKTTVKKDKELSSVKQNKQPDKSRTKTFKIPADIEIPKIRDKRSEQIIKHEGYTVSYNSDYCIANWVAYELTADEALSKDTERSNKFVPDPQVKGATALNEDYTRTGFDRGHLAPAGDMRWSAKAMRESFYFSNICPQKPGLNRGIWKELEEQCRLWAKENGSLFIVTGPVIEKDMRRLGKNRVGVPGQFYKVLCYHDGNEYKAIAFIFENRDYKNTSLQSMAIPVDSVEKVTQIDFFPIIPSEEERKMEAKIDWNSWSF